MTQLEMFFSKLKEHTPAGFNQFYNVCLEATAGPFKGRYYYASDGFYTATFGRNDLMITTGKKISDSKIEQSVNEGYANLTRVPKSKYALAYKFEYLF